VGLDRAQYTAEVMARLKTHAQPLPAHQWMPVPQWALAAAVATAGLIVAVGTVQVQRRQVAERTTAQETALLASLGELDVELPNGDDAATLSQEAEAVDSFIMLAESPPGDEQWLDQTLELIDQLEEDGAEAGEASDGLSEEEWLHELEVLDSAEISASS
jgi:hypothetical protein